MRCPACSKERTRVVDSRSTADSLRRRRECLSCKKRFTTYERAETGTLLVIKKGGVRERFDRDKLMAGVLRACEKRPVSHERVEQLVSGVEQEVIGEQEVTSKRLGNLVMKHLKKLDKVAYIRFASVYREFADVESFEKELGTLRRKK